MLRIEDPAFGASIRRHFGISSFSPTELTAPTIAGLARFESTRGRFNLFRGNRDARTFNLRSAFRTNEIRRRPPAERPGFSVHWIPLYVWRETARFAKGMAVPCTISTAKCFRETGCSLSFRWTNSSNEKGNRVLT